MRPGIAAGVDSDDNRGVTDEKLTRVGAPLLEAFAPHPETAAGRFDAWLMDHSPFGGHLLSALSARWRPLGCFIEVNFIHPELGPAGAVVLTEQAVDMLALRRRFQRMAVIPFGELSAFVPRWIAGETVITRVGEMEEPLRRRYAATGIEWSLNVPIHVEEEWAGVIGAVQDSRGFSPPMVASFEAAGQLVAKEFAADRAWKGFQVVKGAAPVLQLVDQ